jgi:alkylation response protein AidB-like acyl-CoA dehydrogenase
MPRKVSDSVEPFALRPVTDAGRRFLDAIARVQPEIAQRAAEADASGRFIADNVRALCDSGAYAAGVPEALGGGGLDSFHDLSAGIFELGRVCGSTAIASYMHLSATTLMARAWQSLAARGREDAAPHLGEILRGVAEGREVLGVAGSEPGTLASVYPLTEAVLEPDGECYVVTGHKIFATMSPAATLLNAFVRVVREDGDDRFAFAVIRTDWEGVEVIDDWDALGMRGSGSGQVKLSGVRVPAAYVSVGGPVRSLDGPALYNGLVANTGLIAAGLGIAQAARDLVAASAAGRRKAHDGRSEAERPASQLAMGELDTRLWAAKAMAARGALDVDELYARFSPRRAAREDLLQMAAATRATKVFVERTAVDVVDRAMQLTGGGGFMSKHPISRLYRDVRAIPFMIPQASQSLPFIGAVAFGVEPEPS